MITLSGRGLMAIEWSLIGIAFILGLARLDLRFNHRQEGFALRDLFYFLAFATAVTNSSLDTYSWSRSIGVFEEDVDFGVTEWHAPDDVKINAYKIIYIGLFTMYLELYLVKATLITLYFELFGQRSRRTRIYLYLLTGFCISGFITTIFMLLFSCPFGCFWSMSAQCRGQRCQIVKDNVGWTFHFLSDVIIFVLPLIFISRLPMSRAQKISAALTFGLGFINISITVVRWFIVYATFSPSTSFTVDQSLFIVDGHTCLIISILPSLRLYLRLFRSGEMTMRNSRIGSVFSRKASSTYQEKTQPTANP